MSSVLRLSQRLQEEQEQQSCPDSEQQALQLLTVNLERRWEAIVMQVLQWQTRLRRALGTDQVRPQTCLAWHNLVQTLLRY